MLPVTIFLGKLIGLYCIVVAAALTVRGKAGIAAVDALLCDEPLMLVINVMSLVAGLAMVLGHTVWIGGTLPIIVTSSGWLIAVRSAVLLALPHGTMGKMFAAMRYERFFYLYMALTLALGVYLTYASYLVLRLKQMIHAPVRVSP